MTLFLFFSTTAAPMFLPTAYFVELKPHFLFGRHSVLKLFCWSPRILQALRWSRQHHQNYQFSSLLLTWDSSSALATFSCFTFFFNLIHSGISGRKYLFFAPSPLLSGYNGFPVIYSCRKMTQKMNWSGKVHCSSHSLSHVVSLLLTLVSTLWFSRTRGALSYQSFMTQMPTQHLLRELCSLVTLSVFYLVFAAIETAFC